MRPNFCSLLLIKLMRKLKAPTRSFKHQQFVPPIKNQNPILLKRYQGIGIFKDENDLPSFSSARCFC
jgi:hypothetical protein